MFKNKRLNLKKPIVKPVNALKRYQTKVRLRKRGSFSTSTWISLVIRPLFEQNWLKSVIGAQMAVALVAGALVLPIDQFPQNINLSNANTEMKVIEINSSSSLETKNSNYYFLPVASFTGLSQLFHGGHPGIDVRSPYGSSVLAMEGGTVEKIVESNIGYGKHIYINHGNNLVSLYAHLKTIVVKEGQKVFGGQKIGEVGLTGLSTGPHLHFEVSSDNEKIDPMVFIYQSLK